MQDSIQTRSTDVCAQLSTLNFGILLSYWLDYATTQKYDNDFSWRFPIAFQLYVGCYERYRGV